MLSGLAPLWLGRFAPGAEGFLGVAGRGGQALFLFQLRELAIEVALLLQELKAVLHRVLVELAQRCRPSFLLSDLLFDPIEARQRAALVEPGQGRPDLRLGLRPPTARYE